MDAKQAVSPWKDTKDREHDRREKREAVLRVAAQAFCENGVRTPSLDEIAEYNIAKLYDRLERGKIRGDGDNR